MHVSRSIPESISLIIQKARVHILLASWILVRCNHHPIAKTSSQLKLKWVDILVSGQPEITQPQRHMGTTIGWLYPVMG